MQQAEANRSTFDNIFSRCNTRAGLLANNKEAKFLGTLNFRPTLISTRILVSILSLSHAPALPILC
jgi:hypothetical protein